MYTGYGEGAKMAGNVKYVLIIVWGVLLILTRKWSIEHAIWWPRWLSEGFLADLAMIMGFAAIVFGLLLFLGVLPLK